MPMVTNASVRGFHIEGGIFVPNQTKEFSNDMINAPDIKRLIDYGDFVIGGIETAPPGETPEQKRPPQRQPQVQPHQNQHQPQQRPAQPEVPKA